ncbi:helix-turn-helix domain-containing protein [Escherichia coli]
MSDRIRQRRKELNLTQQALADLTGVNRVTGTGWEKDDYQPNGAQPSSPAPTRLNAILCGLLAEKAHLNQR